MDATMRKEFLRGVPAGDEGKAVKAFVEMSKENMVKTKPRVSGLVWCIFFVFAMCFFQWSEEASDGVSSPLDM